MPLNTLYIVCQFSQVEGFIVDKINQRARFLTSLGGLLCLDDDYNTEIIRHFIEQEEITEITIVNDTNCRFIDEVLTTHVACPNPVTGRLKTLMDDYKEVFPTVPSLTEKKRLLAMLNIAEHSREILKNSVLNPLFSQNGIKLNGLVTDRLNEFMEPVAIGA